MSNTFCGADCGSCPFSADCAGCAASNACPFGEPCLVADYCRRGKSDYAVFQLGLIRAFNALSIPDMPTVTELFPLRGAFINMAFPLPGGQTVKFWHDDRIYLGTQLPKQGTDRCYGLAGDDRYLMICEYGAEGADPKLILFRQWQ